jgi:hypothetical protein
MIDYDAGPYTMVVKQMTVEDFSSGKQYVYGDRSGSWESIKIVEYVIFRFHLLLS